MNTKILAVLLAATFTLAIFAPKRAIAVGACTCARFNDFKDHGCHGSPGCTGGPSSGQNNPGGNTSSCPNCPPSKPPAGSPDLAAPDEPDAGTGAMGMPRWWVNEPYINLHVADEPISYKMSSGKDMTFRYTYKQDYSLPQADQIPTFYSTYNDRPRDYDAGNGYNIWPYIHAMQSFAAPYNEYAPNPMEMTNGMTNAAWIHNWQECVVLWDKNWETEYFEDGEYWLYYEAPNPFSDSYEALVFMPDGGIDYFTYDAANQTLNSSTQSRDPISQVQLQSYPQYYPTPWFIPTADSSGTYWGTITNTLSLSYPDGSEDVFGLSSWTGPGPAAAPDTTAFALLTEKIDPQGRVTKLGYKWDSFTNQCDSSAYSFFRLHYIVDPDGRTNTLVYDSSASIPSQLQEFDDPFGRKATFTYAGCSSGSQRGWLTEITDAQNNTSSFGYQSGNGGWMSSLTTPYGTTRFYYGQVAETDATNAYQMRAISVTEPESASQLFAYVHNTSGNVESSAPAPSVPGCAFDDGTGSGTDPQLYHRNSFYWDRRQTVQLSSYVIDNLTNNLVSAISSLSAADLEKGRMQHWLLAPDNISITESISSERDPSPDNGGTIEGERNWYSYGTSNTDLFSADAITAVARILPEGGTNYIRYLYSPATPWIVTQNAQSVTAANGTLGELTNTFTYNNPNFIDVVGINNSLGQYVNIGYNGSHEITSLTNSLGQISRFSYNASTMNLTNIAAYSGANIGLIYSGAYLSQINIQPENKVFNLVTYSGPNPSVIHVTANGVPDLWQTNFWDNLNRITGTSYTDGTAVSNIYTILDLSAHKDRLGNWTHYTHDGLQHLIAVTNALNVPTVYTWCDCGALTSISNALGYVTSFDYNNQGLLTNADYADGSSFGWQFDLVGRLTNEFDGAGKFLNFTYDNQGFVMAISNADGLVWGAAVDAIGRPQMVTNINGVIHSNSFDLLNRVLTCSWTGGGTEFFGYATNGLIAYTNQDSQWTHFGRDAAERLTGVTNIVQNYSIGWNGLDEVSSLIDGLNHTTSWGFNQYGWMIGKTNTLGAQIIAYQEDADGRTTNRWMVGTNTGYTYDAVGNLKSVTYPSSSVGLQYDAINELTNLTDSFGTTSFAWTKNRQLASETGPWANDTVAYSYTQAHLTSLSLSQPSGTPWAQTYNYDSAWRMTSLSSPAGNFGYQYSSVGQELVSGITLPNAAFISNSYDGLGRMTGTALLNFWGHTLDGSAYGMDALGLRTNITRYLGMTTNSVVAKYDGIGELVGWSGKEMGGTLRLNEQLGYTIDAAGNIHNRTNDAFLQVFNADPQNQLTNVSYSGNLTYSGATPAPATNITIDGVTAQLYGDLTFAAPGIILTNGANTFTAVAQNVYGLSVTNISSASFSSSVNLQFDANGNLTNDGLRSFQYDEENQLTNVSVAGQWQVGFIYDGLRRRRIEQDSSWQSGGWVVTNAIRYVYDRDLAIQERDTNNNPIASYTRGLDLSLGLQAAGGVGGLLSRTDTNGSYFFHSDGNGNITALLDGDQNVVARYEYDGFGRLIGQWGTLANVNRYRFSSKEFISQAGVYYYGYRFYEPNLCRWLNRDPIQELGGVNLYGYAWNCPVNTFDAMGYWATGPLQSAAELALEEEAVGGGPEDPVADIGALGTLVAGLAVAALTTSFDPSSNPASQPQDSANAPPAPQPKPGSAQPPNKPPCPPKGPAAAAPNPGKGDNENTARGREAHKWWNPGSGYQKEFTFANGDRADAINFDTQDILELKPNNPDAIAQGQQQLQRYIIQAQKQFGGTWTGSVVTY